MIELLAEKRLIFYDLAQGIKTRYIRAVVKPQTEIAPFGILLVEMVEGAMPMAFFVEFGVICETILNRAQNDCIWVDEAVGFGNDFAVNASRLMVG